MEKVIDDVPTAFFLRLFYLSDSNANVSDRPVGELGL